MAADRSSSPTVLVTTSVRERFGAELRDVAPDARFLAMAPDGTIAEGEDPVFDIAYASTDLFERAPGAGDGPPDAVRHFFVHALKNDALRWFHVAAAGIDSPVFGMLLDKGVRLSTSHHTAIPIAEYVLAQVLRHRVPIDAMEADRRAGRWVHTDWDEVADSRWLVIGMGSIGTEVARRARAFGAHVTGVRRSPTGAEPVDEMIGPDGVVAAAATHDVIVLAVPATSATASMVDAEFLATLGPGTVLVNVGRGALVDEDALRTSLDHDRPARAVLDVTSVEPLTAGHWLWTHPKVVLTSHTSAGGRARHHRALRVFTENLQRWTAGHDLLDEITAADRDAPG